MNSPGETGAASSTVPLQTLFPADTCASRVSRPSVLGLQVASCLCPRLSFQLLREGLGKGFRFHSLQSGALLHREGRFVDPSDWSPAAERPQKLSLLPPGCCRPPRVC